MHGKTRLSLLRTSEQKSEGVLDLMKVLKFDFNQPRHDDGQCTAEHVSSGQDVLRHRQQKSEVVLDLMKVLKLDLATMTVNGQPKMGAADSRSIVVETPVRECSRQGPQSV